MDKTTTRGLDSSNCNSLYGVCEIGLVSFMRTTAYAYLVLMSATLLLVS